MDFFRFLSLATVHFKSLIPGIDFWHGNQRDQIIGEQKRNYRIKHLIVTIKDSEGKGLNSHGGVHPFHFSH